MPPGDPAKPYILIVHGFPSLPTDFHHQITHLGSLGYGIVAPQLLGYGDTSHPSETDAYRLKPMAQDLVDILDQNAIPQVLGIGHDWGVTLLTRLEFYHPTRVTKLALLGIGNAPFAQPFDVDMVNGMMKAKVGYEAYGYMAFFARDADAPQLIDAHQDSFRSLIFQSDPEVCKTDFGATGALRKWLEEDRRSDKKIRGFSDQVHHAHEVAFSNEKGGYAATLNWYRNHVFQHNVPDERAELQRKGDIPAYRVEKPVLLLLAAHDPIALAPIMQQMTEPYAPHLKVRTIGTGHWLMLEDAERVSKELEDFLAA